MIERRIAIVFGLFGGLFYAYLAFAFNVETEFEQFGRFVYNYYFLSLTEGRLDIPAQIIGMEGHYDAQGRAFVYHGLAPVVTRLFAYPFVDLTKVSMAPFTVWFFATLGTVIYHQVFLRALTSNKDIEPNELRLVIVSLMVWFASPGIFLVVNDSLYHEPIAVAFFTTAAFIGIFSWGAFSNGPWGKVLFWMAIFAGITVFARPNVAVGLYAGTVVLGACLFWRDARGYLKSIIGAMLILGIFGSGILIVNMLRFGNPFTMHGSSFPDALEYGLTYFGIEENSTPRNLAFAMHGRFNIGRILPNFMLHIFDFPIPINGLLDSPFIEFVRETYSSLTANLGFIRNEFPRLGILYNWMPWFLLLLTDFMYLKFMPRMWWIILVGASVIALLLASYGTITLRYRFELWPLVAVLNIAVLFGATQRGISKFGNIRAMLLGITLAYGLFVTVLLLPTYNVSFNVNGLFGMWSYDTCKEMVLAKKSLDEGAVARICILDLK